METFLQDLRFGARTLRRSPGFTSVAIIALALGIGGNSAIFSVVNAVLLRPLPYAEPDRIMRVFASAPERGLSQTNLSFKHVTALVEQNNVFEQVGAYVGDSVNLTGIDDPLQLDVTRVSAGFLDVLNINPVIGRNFLPEEDKEGGARVVMLSHNLWQRQFAGAPDIVGKAIALDTLSYTVVGVAPAGFNFPIAQVDAYIPRVFEPSFLPRDAVERGAGYLNVVARLKPGVTRQQAQADVDSLAANNSASTQLDLHMGMLAIPLSEVATRGVRPTLFILLGAVGFVLLIACANVANLLLAKAAGRQKEIAVRSALGASRFRLIRQLLTESVLLALMSGALGVALASWGVALLVSAATGNIPRAAEIRVDGRVLGFTLLIAIVTGVIFGLAPALQASRVDLNEALKDTARGSGGGSRRARVRGALVVIEVALSVILLIGAGLLMRSFLRLRGVDTGFNPANLLVATINLPASRYSEPAQRVGFYRRLSEDLASLPGVTSVGMVQGLPLTGYDARTPMAIDGGAVLPLPERPIVSVNVVGLDYFKTMGVPLLEGRFFTDHDNESSPLAALINRSFARKFFPDEDPIGKRLLPGGTQRQPREIVGVVGDVRQIGLDTSPAEGFYLCSNQRPQLAMNVVIRTDGAPLALRDAVRSRVVGIDKDQPIATLETMEEVVSRSISNQRFTLLLLGLFASVALVLAAIGIYGLPSYAVGQRTYEIGIRMAMGARNQDVLRMIVREGMKMTLIGGAIGLAVSLPLPKILNAILTDAHISEPGLYFLVPALILAVAMLATYIPARRAARTDPMKALRQE